MGFDVEKAIGELDRARTMFAQWVRSTPEERIGWRPPTEGGDPTTIAEQVKHCLDVEAAHATLMFGGEAPAAEGGEGDYFASSSWAKAGPAGALTAKEDLLRCLEDTGQRTAELIRGYADGDWDEVVDAGFAKMSKARFVGLLGHHWWWHVGQVAYIQRLYGDTTMGG